MKRSNIQGQHDDNEVDSRDPEATPELEGISPLNPSTFPRAEDDEETLAHSPEFHDLPDPGPDVGRRD